MNFSLSKLEIVNLLWSRSRFEGDCLLYTHPLNTGYGEVWIDGQNYRVHRLIAHLFHGLDLLNHREQALHKLICKNKNCWIPDHLYVGTASENLVDRTLSGAKVNQNVDKTHCPQGHEYTKENTVRWGLFGGRRCKQCERARSFAKNRRKKDETK